MGQQIPILQYHNKQNLMIYCNLYSFFPVCILFSPSSQILVCESVSTPSLKALDTILQVPICDPLFSMASSCSPFFTVPTPYSPSYHPLFPPVSKSLFPSTSRSLNKVKSSCITVDCEQSFFFSSAPTCDHKCVDKLSKSTVILK